VVEPIQREFGAQICSRFHSSAGLIVDASLQLRDALKRQPPESRSPFVVAIVSK
jgi:hypothetical protein